MEETEDHRKTVDAVPRRKGTFSTSRGMKRNKRATWGWEFLVRWKGGNTDWVTLKELKDPHPAQLADCVFSNSPQEEPASTWWLPHVHKKRKAIVNEVKSKSFQWTHKRGLLIPKTWKEALETDEENGDHLWWEAIKQEMKNSQVAMAWTHLDVMFKMCSFQSTICRSTAQLREMNLAMKRARFSQWSERCVASNQPVQHSGLSWPRSWMK